MSERFKTCSRCKETKSVEEFGKNKSRKDGPPWPTAGGGSCKSPIRYWTPHE